MALAHIDVGFHEVSSGANAGALDSLSAADAQDSGRRCAQPSSTTPFDPEAISTGSLTMPRLNAAARPVVSRALPCSTSSIDAICQEVSPSFRIIVRVSAPAAPSAGKGLAFALNRAPPSSAYGPGALTDAGRRATDRPPASLLLTTVPAATGGLGVTARIAEPAAVAPARATPV